MQRRQKLLPRKPRDIRRAYREMIEEMDSGVGQVVAALAEHGLSERTLVFFFSDNGGTPKGSNGPLRGYKGSVWEGGHRVPAIACWPGTIAAGGVRKQTAISLDLAPTILKLAGVAPPEGHFLDGVDLAPLLKDGSFLPPRRLFWQYNKLAAVRQGPWKLVVGSAPIAAPRLYHLDDDLAEANNLAAAHPEITAQLMQSLKSWRRDVANGATVQPANTSDQKAAK